MQLNNPLSIESLENDLRHAQGALEKATADRTAAQEIEGQWITEVNSLKSLIDVRKKRLHGHSNGTGQEHKPQPPTVPQDTPGVVARTDGDMTTVAWIENFVLNSGAKGASPPEILRAAADIKLFMNKNYPYIVLSKLVERGKIDKRDGRYYWHDL